MLGDYHIMDEYFRLARLKGIKNMFPYSSNEKLLYMLKEHDNQFGSVLQSQLITMNKPEYAKLRPLLSL